MKFLNIVVKLQSLRPEADIKLLEATTTHPTFKHEVV